MQEGSLISLNEEAIIEDAAWDGFHGLSVSKGSQLQAGEVLQLYRGLWRVEEAFRVAKCTLKTRPIFHHTSQRIKAHVLLCFMNLFLESYLEKLLRRNGFILSPEEIKYAISQVHTIVIEDGSTGQKVEIQSSLTKDAKKIFSTLGLSTERTTTMKTSCCA